MARYVAFLRAINVGGRVVKMDKLRGLFESLGHAGVETFIASGNVVFESRAKAPSLERAIEAALADALGYEVATFIRTDDEVAEIARQQPFRPAPFKTAKAFCVGLLAAPLSRDGEKALMSFKSADDDFRVVGREIYWLCQTGQGVSAFSNAGFEKAAKVRSTFRGMNTMQRLSVRLRESAAGANRPRRSTSGVDLGS